MHAVESELVQEIEVVECEIRDVLDPLDGRGATMAGMTRSIDREVPGQLLLEREPASGRAGAVKEEKRGPGTVREQVHGGAAHRKPALRWLAQKLTGRALRPRSTWDSRHSGRSVERASRGSRWSKVPRVICPSNRASGAPRQK